MCIGERQAHIAKIHMRQKEKKKAISMQCTTLATISTPIAREKQGEIGETAFDPGFIKAIHNVYFHSSII